MNFIILTLIMIVLITLLVLKNNSKFKSEQKSNFVRKSRTNHIFYKY